MSAATIVPVRSRSTRGYGLEGARDITPMVIGVIPMALAIGASVGTSAVSDAQGIVSAAGILAGAAQIHTIEMLDAGASGPIIVLSALMINARLLLYSASIAPWFRHEPLYRQLILAIPVVDQMHFTCIPRFAEGDLTAPERLRYYTGAAAWLVSAWITSQTCAILAASHMPASAGLHIAAPLALIGLLAKSSVDRRTKHAAAIAAPLAVIGVGLPFNSSVLVAIVVAIAVDMVRATPEASS